VTTGSLPEFPYPFPPDREPPHRPDRAVPTVSVPMVPWDDADPRQRLFDRRTVLVGGPLDAAAAGRLSVELMALDGRSVDDVELIINSPGGPLGEVGAVLDVIGLMRAAVSTTCTGRAEGTAAVLLACGTGRRRIGPHASVSLRCRHVEAIEGSAAEFGERVAELTAVRDHLVAALARATGLTAEELTDELVSGRSYDAGGAVARGLADEVTVRPG